MAPTRSSILWCYWICWLQWWITRINWFRWVLVVLLHFQIAYKENRQFQSNSQRIYWYSWYEQLNSYESIPLMPCANALLFLWKMTEKYGLQERADVEWKFARSRLWISYFEEGGTCPPPFNIIPAPKSIWYIVEWMKKKFFGRSKTIKKEHMKTIRVSISISLSILYTHPTFLLFMIP